MAKAVTVSFDKYGGNYERLLRAFINSWEANSSIPLEVHRINPPETYGRSAAFYYNHRKLRQWIDSVDQDTIFIDCDMLCLKDPVDGFDLVDHIGYTDREGPIPFNGGVVFVKNTKESKEFLKKWYDIDEKMLYDEKFHKDYYHPKYAGMNQSSMGWMYENGYDHLIRVLPDIYNKCDGWTGWQQAKMVHVKGHLRNCCLFDRSRDVNYIMAIKEVWKQYAEASDDIQPEVRKAGKVFPRAESRPVV